jgi:hypothetical protein
LTVNDGVEARSTLTAGHDSRFWLNQSEMPILPAINHGHRICGGVPEDDDRVAAVANLCGGIFDRHRLDRIATGADDSPAVL